MLKNVYIVFRKNGSGTWCLKKQLIYIHLYMSECVPSVSNLQVVTLSSPSGNDYPTDLFLYKTLFL